ncbi:MAG TPA: hypothetical protein VMW04_02850 [Patescibacteria group bacterium]|nr:hypothetical protein [Patescibacteria group bacterium]
MTSVDNLEGESNLGEWTTRLKDWKRKDALYLAKASNEPTGLEELFSPEERGKTIRERRLQFFQEFQEKIFGTRPSGEMGHRYCPSAEVFDAAIEMVESPDFEIPESPEIEEKLKENLVRELEMKKKEAQKVRGKAEKRALQEKGNL